MKANLNHPTWQRPRVRQTQELWGVRFDRSQHPSTRGTLDSQGRILSGCRPAVLEHPAGLVLYVPWGSTPPSPAWSSSPRRPWLFTAPNASQPFRFRCLQSDSRSKWSFSPHPGGPRAKLLSVWDPPIPSQKLSWSKELLLKEYLYFKSKMGLHRRSSG